MKKLLVASVFACVTMLANAAVYKWDAKSDWVSADGSDPLEVMAYVFDASAYSIDTVSGKLTSGDTSILSSAMASALINDEGWFSLSGNGLTDDGGSPLYARMFTIILDSSSASAANYFYASSVISQKITDAVIADGASFVWDEIVTGAPGGAGWTAVAPEPTSGLLLLLGMAGLALKRKRA